MYFYPIISYFRASGSSSQGTPITLADFMNKGVEYRQQIESYRAAKREVSALRDRLHHQKAEQQRIEEIVQLGINPLDPDSESEYNAAIAMREEVSATISGLEEAIRQQDTQVSRIKRSLPAATLSGYFEPKRKESDLKQHSGFICIDIDDHFNRKNSAGQNVSFPQSLDNVTDVLQQLPWVLYAAHSVGGVGYFAIIPLGPITSEKTHKWYFECLEEEFREYGLIIDPACSDVTRLRIITYDEHPYRNPHAVPYTGRYGFVGREERKRREDEARRAAEAAAYRASLNRSDSDILRDVEACVQQIEQRSLDITQDYKTTVKIGMALYSLGDSGLYLWKRICRFRSSDHSHLRTDSELEQHWRRFGSGKTVAIAWFFKYLVDTESSKYGHPAWTVYAHKPRT